MQKSIFDYIGVNKDKKLDFLDSIMASGSLKEYVLDITQVDGLKAEDE